MSHLCVHKSWPVYVHTVWPPRQVITTWCQRWDPKMVNVQLSHPDSSTSPNLTRGPSRRSTSSNKECIWAHAWNQATTSGHITVWMKRLRVFWRPLTLKYDTVVQKFNTYFKVRRNTIFWRAKFYHRSQQGGESVEQYITDLYELAKFYKYVKLKEMHLVVGIWDLSLSEKMQTDSDLM